jgi:RNA polymerase sigma factor (TIGR02999 family)
MTDKAGVTQLLHAWRTGDEQALAQLTPVVYQELHRLARGVFRGERADHTLQPTALVHEAFLKLVDCDVAWQSRTHFYALAARQMRRILVNHALAHRAAKRGGDVHDLPLDEVPEIRMEDRTEITDIDDALNRLAQFDPRKSDILELHFFGGLTYEELAEAVGLSTTTLNVELRLAKAWLKQELAG